MPRQTLTKRADGRYACKYEGRFFYGKTANEAFASVMITSACRNEDITWA